MQQSRTDMILDDGTTPRPRRPAEAKKPASAKAAKDDAKDEAKDEAKEEVKPDGADEKPAAKAAENVAVEKKQDGDIDLAKRQEELKAQAKKERDPQRAIDLYTKAVDTDPYAPGARDAYLERARLYLADGQLDLAEKDLFSLQRRKDIGPVQSDVAQMLQDVEKARKAMEQPPEP